MIFIEKLKPKNLTVIWQLWISFHAVGSHQAVVRHLGPLFLYWFLWVVKNGSSFITSIISPNNLSNENKCCTGVFVFFKTKRESKWQFYGITEILRRTFWQNKWRSIYDIVKDSSYCDWFTYLSIKLFLHQSRAKTV